MSYRLPKGFPRQQLIFFVAQDIDPEIKAAVRALVERLGSERQWVISPPSLICSDPEIDPSAESEIDIVGGELEIYSAMSGALPREIDLEHLGEVEHLVAAVRELSKAKSLSFEFELDGKFVGAIDDGVVNRSLSEGLLGEWRKHLSK